MVDRKDTLPYRLCSHFSANTFYSNVKQTMSINYQARFNQVYQAYLNELTLQGKSPKTVDMYSRYLH